MTPRLAIPVIVGVIVGGCSGSNTSAPPTPPAPLAEAYPRLALPTTDTIVVDTHTGLGVNPSATVVAVSTADPGTKAITVTYPGTGVHIYYTVRPVSADDMKAAIDNRLERMSLNLGGVPAQTEHTAPDSPSEGVLLTARSGVQTPVQLLVADADFVVSGTAFIDDARATTNYDSIRPIIEMLRDDMSRAVPSALFIKQ